MFWLAYLKAPPNTYKEFRKRLYKCWLLLDWEITSLQRINLFTVTCADFKILLILKCLYSVSLYTLAKWLLDIIQLDHLKSPSNCNLLVLPEHNFSKYGPKWWNWKPDNLHANLTSFSYLLVCIFFSFISILHSLFPFIDMYVNVFMFTTVQKFGVDKIFICLIQ